MNRAVWILVIALFVFPLASCEKGGGNWPEKPSDGSQVALKFVELEGQDRDLGAKMEVFNFSDKAIHRMVMDLHYLDAGGQELKNFPWSQQASPIVDGKASKVLKMGAFLPAETKQVTVTVKEVQFADGSKWPAGT